MIWRILPHATACIVSEQLFLLDIRQDRYFRVPAGAASEMLAWLRRNYAGVVPKSAIETLTRARILRAGDPDPTNALKERVAIPDGLERPEVRDAGNGLPVSVAIAVARTRLALRIFSLHSILSDRRVRPPLAARGHDNAAHAEAAAFERARRMVPFARNCLLDSLTLDRWLARHGIGSQLVFGITAEPFTAHCWLQTSDSILNDSFDHVSGFTPILVL
jgi:hypothetical protein